MLGEKNKLTAKKIVWTIIFLLIFPLLILGLSGDSRWSAGWIFSAWFFALCLTTIIYLYFKDPALLAERYNVGGAQTLDKYFLLAFVVLFFAFFAVMPLDAERFRWTAQFPIWLKTAGAFLLAAASFFLFRSFADNTFLSPVVRIQSERKQMVISSGVYGFVRHPMYLGAVFLFFGAPLFLNSIGGILIGLLMTILLIARIVGEEKLLVNQLEGYAEYRRKVRYRLFPFVW